MTGYYCRQCQAYHQRFQQASPYKANWTDHAKDAGETLLGVIVLLALFLGIPFLLWVIAGGLS